MTFRLGCIADDYTGASDLANTLTKCGLRTVQTIGIPAESLCLRDVDVVVVSLKIRSVAAAEAVVQACAADAWLRKRGASHIMYKICSTFDSTDAGNIGPVLDALRADSGDATVVVTPAFPETARTVYQGNLFVGSLPLDESPLKDHPLNPMRDANLVRVLSRQSRSKVGLIDLRTVAAGPAAIRSRLADLANDGFAAAIADAVFERDLEAIGAASLDQHVSIGASGLGFGLARGLIASGVIAAVAGTAAIGAPVGGRAACLAGSCSQATLAQIACAERVMPVLRLDPDGLIYGAQEVQRALTWASEHLDKGPILLASSATPDQVAAVQARHGRSESGHAIEQAMATIAAGLLDRGARRLVVAGGETAGAVVDRLAIPAFLVGPEIAPGVPVLRAIEAKSGEMLLTLKSGNFGGPDFFMDALRMMP
jgi:3-dehydrotetronate 4-kinase